MVGTFNELTYLNGVPQTLADQLKNFDQWDGPQTYPHFAAGWAVAGDTPFAYSKQVVSDFGGTKNGMVVHWPSGKPPPTAWSRRGVRLVQSVSKCRLSIKVL
jgi:arylsulfatase